MDLWQLKVFCHVVENESFSRAGAAVHLSQPTVSSHIRDLEQSAGCRLIDRLPKKAVPTRAGELLYRYAKKLLALRAEAEAALAEFQGVVKGGLAVGGSTIPGVYLLPRAIGGFLKRYPEVKISLELGDTAAITEQILSGDLELAVVGARSDDSRLEQVPLIEDVLQVVVPPAHPWRDRSAVSFEQLCAEPFILREQGSGTLAAIRERLAQHGLPVDALNVVARMGSTEAVRQGVKAGLGVSILSALAVSEDVETNRLAAIRLDGVDLTRHFFLTSHRGRTLSPIAETFRDYLKECS